MNKDRLEALYREHGSCRAVGDALGFSAEYVRGLMVKHGVQRKKRGPPRKFDVSAEALRSDYQSMTMAQIAQKYGFGETTVFNRLKEFGIEHDWYGDQGHKHRKRDFSAEHREKIGDVRRGKFGSEAKGNWKGGAAFANIALRRTAAYSAWRKGALALRGYACQECGAKEGAVCECCGYETKLHVHHVKSFAEVAESRFDPANSEVLCPKCHRKRHYRKSGEFGGTRNT